MAFWLRFGFILSYFGGSFILSYTGSLAVVSSQKERQDKSAYKTKRQSFGCHFYDFLVKNLVISLHFPKA